MLIHNGKQITAENITVQDVEEIFDFDKDVMLKHRLNLGKEYVEKQFPENVEQTSRVKKILARNIELSDPKTFKDPKPALTYGKVFKPGTAKKYAKRNVVKKESNNLYTKALVHTDMKRVKELKVEKEIKKLEKEYQLLITEIKEIQKERSKHYDWRTGKDLTETMVTTDAINTTLPAEGNVDLAAFDFAVASSGSSPGYSQSGNNYTFGSADDAASLVIVMNSEIYDTIVFDFEGGNIDALSIFTGTPGSNVYTLSTANGRKEVRLKQSDRVKSTSISFNISGTGDLGTNKVLNVAFRRLAPMNVFVGLDDPEASAFIRDGTTDKVSNEEKKKRLEKQLAASKEYLNKMFGEGMPGTNTVISDTTPQKSYTEIAGIWQSPDGTYYSRPPVSRPDTSNWPSIHDKPQPIKFPTPGINRSGQGRGTV